MTVLHLCFLYTTWWLCCTESIFINFIRNHQVNVDSFLWVDWFSSIQTDDTSGQIRGQLRALTGSVPAHLSAWGGSVDPWPWSPLLLAPSLCSSSGTPVHKISVWFKSNYRKRAKSSLITHQLRSCRYDLCTMKIIYTRATVKYSFHLIPKRKTLMGPGSNLLS